jgi:hypothetical protein
MKVRNACRFGEDAPDEPRAHQPATQGWWKHRPNTGGWTRIPNPRDAGSHLGCTGDVKGARWRDRLPPEHLREAKAQGRSVPVRRDRNLQAGGIEFIGPMPEVPAAGTNRPESVRVNPGSPSPRSQTRFDRPISPRTMGGRESERTAGRPHKISGSGCRGATGKRGRRSARALAPDGRD